MNNYIHNHPYRLKDFIQFNPKEKLPKGAIARKITMEQLSSNNRYVESNIFEEYKGGSKFRNGDTIMARITPCLENGKTAYITSLNENELAFGSTEFIVFRKIEGKSNSKYIYYLLKTPQIRDIAIKSMVGSSGRQRVQQNVLENYEVLLPTLDKQIEIASILSSLDDKIELNRRINENLEQQAQALFNYYFIEHSEILGDYEKGNLTEIATYTNGLPMQKFRPQDEEKGMPVLKIKELGQGQTDNSSDICSENIANEYKVTNGDVIFSWSGTLMVKVWCGGLCGLNQHLFKVTSEKYPKWYYYFWTKFHLNKFIRIAQDKAVTMGHIRRGDLESSEVLVPKMDILAKLNEIINPIFNQIIGIQCENRNLAQLRDTLLPRLMSGKLEIKDNSYD